MTVSSRLRVGAVGGALALIAGAAAPTPAFAADLIEDEITLDHGHVDAFNLMTGDDGEVVLSLKEDVTASGTLRDPNAVTLEVKSDAYSVDMQESMRPESGLESFYHLPSSQDTVLGLVWPGWDSLDLQGSDYAQGQSADIDIDISEAEGPGEVYLYQVDGVDPYPVFEEGNLELGGTIHQSSLAHVHAHWAFTEPGTYTFTAQATATHPSGAPTSTSDEQTYTFSVAPAPESVEVSGAEDEVEAGSEVELTATQGPDGASFTSPGWEWETRASEGADWEAVEGETAETLTVDAVDGAQYRATVSGGKDYAGGSSRGNASPISIASDPVTIDATEGEEPVTTLSIEGLEDSYEVGDTASLTAVQDPETDEDHYHWFIQRDGDDEFEVISEALTENLEYEVAEGDHGAEVKAVLYDHDHAEIAESEPVTLNVPDEDVDPDYSLEITGLAHHYHQGSDIDLNAVVDPEIDDASYEWFVQRVDQDEAVQVEGNDGDAFTITAEQALDDAEVTANVLDADDNVLASDAATIDVDDHGEPAHQEVTVTGAADHYHTGDTAVLTADVDPASVLDRFEWEVQLGGSDEWSTVDGENAADYAFEVTEELDGAQLRAALTFDDGQRYAVSEPVSIEIDDHDHDHPETDITIEGLLDEYEVGDIAELTAVQDPDTDEDHYHWFIQRDGDDEFEVISEALTENLEYEVAEGDHGAEVKAVLYDHDHHEIAESDAVTLNVTDDPGQGPPGDEGEDENGDDNGRDGDGEGRNGGSNDGDGSGKDGLADTGADLNGTLIGATVLLLLAAAGVALAARRRTRAETAE